MPVELPSNFKPLRDLAEKQEGLLAARQEAAAELRRLNTELEAAIEQDRKAFADRLAKDVGATDPGGKEETKTREKIAATKSRYDALSVAVKAAELEITEAFTRGQAKWLAEAEADCEKTRKKYAAAVDALSLARAQYDDARTLVRWLEGVPLRKASAPFAVVARALGSRNGEPLSFAAVAAGLREDAAPPERQMSQILAKLEPEFEHAA